MTKLSLVGTIVATLGLSGCAHQSASSSYEPPFGKEDAFPSYGMEAPGIIHDGRQYQNPHECDPLFQQLLNYAEKGTLVHFLQAPAPLSKAYHSGNHRFKCIRKGGSAYASVIITGENEWQKVRQEMIDGWRLIGVAEKDGIYVWGGTTQLYENSLP